MKRLSWLLIAAPVLFAGCPAEDDEETSGAESMTVANTSEDPGTDADPTMADSSGGDTSSIELGCAAEIDHDTGDGASDDLMQTWGAPCSEDAQCVELLGEGGTCLFTAVIYELPGGYCSKLCTLPEGEQYNADAADCDPNGGVDCLGQAPLLQVCAPRCSDDNQCSRDGYTCRELPMLASEGDPTYCLMPDCCQDTCAEE